MNFWQKIKARFSLKCAYADVCKYYNSQAQTCNDDLEAENYCGKRRDLEDQEWQETINKIKK